MTYTKYVFENYYGYQMNTLVIGAKFAKYTKIFKIFYIKIRTNKSTLKKIKKTSSNIILCYT